MCEPTDQPNSQQGQQHCQIEFYAIETTPACPRFPLETSVRFPERLVRSGVDVRRSTHFGWHSSSAGMHADHSTALRPSLLVRGKRTYRMVARRRSNSSWTRGTRKSKLLFPLLLPAINSTVQEFRCQATIRLCAQIVNAISA